MPPRHVALATLVAVIWGVNFVVIDLGLDGFPPMLLLAVRFVVVLVPALWLVPRPQVPWRDVVLVGACMSLGQFTLLYTAIAVGLPAGLASLLLQAQVVLTIVLSAGVLHERPTRPQVIGVAIGAVGLGIVAVGRAATTPALGVVLVVGAATSWALGNVAARRAAARGTGTRPPGDTSTRTPDAAPARGAGLSMTVWSATVVPVPLLLLSLVVDGPAEVAHALAHPTLAAALATAYTAWVATLVGYGIWNTLLAHHASSAVVPFAMLVPVVGLASAWAVLDELPNAWEATGGAVLLLGVAVATLVRPRPRPRSRPRTRPRPRARAGHAEGGTAPAGTAPPSAVRVRRASRPSSATSR
ncbi:O-acetylserine/cysteine efflux transporter [Sediminihabitans luteus]|uniref:O-acetylserine/cysteine efflux transporter n=1 Tax=Sediminihabitans luteus TaxID=1138585 RepID=A0A2M9D0D9_9CELL|nr:EamA family transporter [Sediminihabitans luteus]PJJ77620.1 O-acetylserine/cysteine efflux transporter [Sediminihabitans luteus]GII98520.1 membrane protein [Sediminihabitans luteus]